MIFKINDDDDDSVQSYEDATRNFTMFIITRTVHQVNKKKKKNSL